MATTESPGQRLLRSIGVPEAEEFLEWIGDADGGHFLGSIITPDIARSLWLKWVPDQPDRIADADFREAFRQMVSEFVALGLNVEHLRDMARTLPDPTFDRSNWISLFEGAVAGREKCKLRIILNPTDYRDCIKDREENGEKWSEISQMMRDGLFYELGIVYPTSTLHSDDTLGEHEFRVEWNDVELPARRGIARDRILVNATVGYFSKSGITAERATNPANGNECALVDATQKRACEDLGLTTWTWLGHLILSISAVLRRASPVFVNRYLIEFYLNSLVQVWPQLVRDVRDRVDRDELVQVLRGLLSDEISIRDLRAILESVLLAQASPLVAEPSGVVFSHPGARPCYRTPTSTGRPTVADYIEHARAACSKYVTHKYTRGERALNVYRVAPPAEERLRQPAELGATDVHELLTAVRDEVAKLSPGVSNPVVLSTVQARFRLRSWIRIEFPHLAVLSHNELLPATEIREIGHLAPDIKAYDESLSRLLDAAAALTENGDPAAPAEEPTSPRDAAIARILTEQRGEVVSAVIAGIKADSPAPLPRDILERLVARYFDGYRDLLTTGRTDRFDAALRTFSAALRAEGTRPSAVLRIASEVHQHATAVLWRELDNEAGAETVRRISAILDLTADVAHRIVATFRGVSVGQPIPG